MRRWKTPINSVLESSNQISYIIHYGYRDRHRVLQHKEFIPSCIVIRCKVFDVVSVSKRRFWPSEWLREEKFRIKIGSAFLCYFLLQKQKKVGN